MKAKLIFGLMVFFCVGVAYGQGEFWFWNPGAPTRIGSEDGPLAGNNIWAQMTVGWTPESLIPIAVPVRHFQTGRANGGNVVVPHVPPNELAFIQMVAWDGDLWGDTLEEVPPNWLGRTDIVSMRLVWWWQPHSAPEFHQSAIVPIPEPAALTLVGLGLALVAVGRRRSERGAT